MIQLPPLPDELTYPGQSIDLESAVQTNKKESNIAKMKDVGAKIDEEAWDAMSRFGEQMKRLQAESPWMFVPMRTKRKLKIRLFFAWWDMWVGAYYDRTFKILYVCLIPCCALKIWRERMKWMQLDI